MLLWSPSKPEDGPSIDVSAGADPPWNRLSADYQHGQIPVPGMKGMYSETVRGLLEGLKLIGRRGRRGRINTAFFSGPWRPREPKDGEWELGYSLDGRRVGPSDANVLVFIPSYVWMLENKAYAVVAALRQLARHHEERGESLYVHDGLENGDAYDPRPLSSAAILAAFVQDNLAEFVKMPWMQ